VQLDRGHDVEIHSLQRVRKLGETYHGNEHTKYPVRRVRGRKMIVANVSRRLKSAVSVWTAMAV